MGMTKQALPEHRWDGNAQFPRVAWLFRGGTGLYILTASARAVGRSFPPRKRDRTPFHDRSRSVVARQDFTRLSVVECSSISFGESVLNRGLRVLGLYIMACKRSG